MDKANVIYTHHFKNEENPKTDSPIWVEGVWGELGEGD